MSKFFQPRRNNYQAVGMKRQPTSRTPYPVNKFKSDYVSTLSGPLSPRDLEPKTADKKEMWVHPVPVIDSKYLQVWHRAFAKIRAQRILQEFTTEMNLFGTSVFGTSDEATAADVDVLVKQYQRNKGKRAPQVIQTEVPWFMFHPNRTPKRIWSIVVVFLLVYTATVMPYRMAFIEYELWDDWFFIDLAIDSLFFCDFVVNCFSAYLDGEGYMVIDRKLILINYAKGWMLLDLLAWFPFSFLVDNQQESQQSGSGSYKNFIRLLRLPRLYRLFRITRILKLLKANKRSPLFMKLQEFLRMRSSSVRIWSITVSVILLAHISAWVWFLMAKLDGFGPDTWVQKGEYMNHHESFQYMLAIYWAFQTMSTVGYGDITGHSLLEMMLSIILMVFGIWLFTFTIGSISSILTNLDAKQGYFNTKMAIIDEFAKDAMLDQDLRLRLRAALNYTTEKIGFSQAVYQHWFSELPRDLRYEMAQCMHKGSWQKLSFFKGRDRVFIATIVPFLQPREVKKWDIIFHEHEYSDEIYFIVRGRITYVYQNEGEYVVYKGVQQGAYFGDIEVIKQINRKYSCQAIQDCELLILNRDLYQTLEEDFPAVAEEMKSIAEVKDRMNEKAKKTLQNWLMQQKRLHESPTQISKKLSLETLQNQADETVDTLLSHMKKFHDTLDRFMISTDNRFDQLEKAIAHSQSIIAQVNQRENSAILPTLHEVSESSYSQIQICGPEISRSPHEIYEDEDSAQADGSKWLREKKQKEVRIVHNQISTTQIWSQFMKLHQQQLIVENDHFTASFDLQMVNNMQSNTLYIQKMVDMLQNDNQEIDELLSIGENPTLEAQTSSFDSEENIKQKQLLFETRPTPRAQPQVTKRQLPRKSSTPNFHSQRKQEREEYRKRFEEVAKQHQAQAKAKADGAIASKFKEKIMQIEENWNDLQDIRDQYIQQCQAKLDNYHSRIATYREHIERYEHKITKVEAKMQNMDSAVVDLDMKTATPVPGTQLTPMPTRDMPGEHTPLQSSRTNNDVPFEDSGESIIVHKSDPVASDLGILKLIPGLNLPQDIKPSGITSLCSPIESSPDLDRFQRQYPLTERNLLPQYDSQETIEAMLATNTDTVKEVIRDMPVSCGNLHTTTKFLSGRMRRTGNSRRRTREHKMAQYDELLRKNFKVIKPF